MTKYIIYLSLVLATLTACTAKDNNSKSIEEHIISTSIESPIDFEIERTTLSKGFQSINPHVDIIDKDIKPSFIVNFGIVDCSKMNIDKITKTCNEINIYASRTIEYDTKNIVVPQILIKLNDIDYNNLKDIKFNIISSNYETIHVKHDKNHVLDNIYAKCKITSNTIPKVDLIKENNSYIWNIELSNVFSKEIINTPLVYFTAKVDSSNGEIIETNNKIISDAIDNGNIVDFVDGKFILYTQKISNDTESYQNLWLYDIEKNDKNKVLSTHNAIYSAEISPDLKKIAIIEHNEKLSDVFIVDLEKNETKKITPLVYNHIWNIRWHENNLYALNNNQNKATLIFFDLEKNSNQVLFRINKNISDFDVYNDKFALTEFNEAENTKNIFITRDGKKLEKIDSSHNPRFIDSDRLLCNKNVVDQNKSTLWLYDDSKKSVKSITDMDIRSFSIIDSNTIFLVSRENYGTEFSILTYDLSNDTVEALSQVITETVYYSKNTNTIYFSLLPPIDNLDTSIIYSVNLNDINVK